MQKLKLHSPDLTQANIDKLAAISELFPNCVTESKGADGEVKRAVDFDQLRQELSATLVEGPQERYQLNWPGKREALLTANAPIAKTLRPCRAESVDFDTTQNLFIEGDNLDALKLLQETYLNKVKMIYIDPPYNTGKDFIYKDNFAEDSEAYKLRSNQYDAAGNRLAINTESNGRFHSDWLSMMYPRLKLARNLLREDGVVFISIDDSEQTNLKRVCDEIFGENNFIAKFIHKNNSSKNQSKLVSVSTEYFYCYSKNNIELNNFQWRIEKKGASDIAKKFLALKKDGLNIDDISLEIKDLLRRPKYAHLSRWNKVDENGVFKDADLSREGGAKNYTIKNPLTGKDCVIPARGWGKSLEELLRLQAEGLIWYGDESTPPGQKDYITADDVAVPDNFWYFDNSIDTRELRNMFGALVFENPKPKEMIKTIISLHTQADDLILDFFSGSATTAHAVMQLNAEAGGKRKFIMVQIPEACDNKSDAFKMGYKNIADISKERIRLAGKKIKQENAITAPDLDIGFRVLKIDSSNMKEVFYTPDAVSQDLLSDQVNNIREDRTAEDLLFQVLLDWGVDLALPISQETIDGKTVFFVDDNALAACFETDINEDFVKLLAKSAPQSLPLRRVVFRDAGFASDSVKINVEQIFKLMSPGTEVKTI